MRERAQREAMRKGKESKETIYMAENPIEE